MADKARFEAIWQRLTGGSSDSAWAALAGYADPQRAYHNTDHLDAMLAGLDLVRGEAEFVAAHFGEVELAIWFHDAIYDPLAKDNEAQSASLFRDCMAPAASMPARGVDHIEAMILATATHAPDADLSTRLLLDLDLRVLGSASDAYQQYARAVRAEYSAVPDDAWRAGRPAVLRRFLERDAIYQTRYFNSRLEELARKNLAEEIAALEALTA